MDIGIDASRAVIGRRTGTEAYAYFLIQALLPLAVERGHGVHLYFNQAPEEGLFPAGKQIQHHILPFPRLWTHIRLAGHLHRTRPDVFFTPAHVIPFTYHGASIATVHDLGYHYFPEAHTRSQVAYLKWSTRHNARRSRVVLADSQATKDDLVKFYGVDGEKIEVVYPGRDTTLQPITDLQTLATIQQKYRIKPPYLIYISTLQPRKNLERLIQAYADSRVPHQFVLAGKMGWRAQPILDAISALPAEIADNVQLLGFIPDEDKAALLTGATALLYPSLYEGFGFPILEAQACGTPVITANNSSLSEVAGDSALYVPAGDTNALTKAIQTIVQDGALQSRLREAGLANVERFSWQATARQTLNCLEQTVSSRLTANATN